VIDQILISLCDKIKRITPETVEKIFFTDRFVTKLHGESLTMPKQLDEIARSHQRSFY
jgi:hypothetical protein